jgi:DNA transformation protein and related proteins
MAPSAQYKEYVLERLQPIGPVRTGRFFGGVGLYRQGSQFAMMIGNCLYFVVDDTTRPRYELVGIFNCRRRYWTMLSNCVCGLMKQP